MSFPSEKGEDLSQASPPLIKLHLWGRPRMVVGGTSTRLGSRKHEELLCYVAARGGEATNADIRRAIWGLPDVDDENLRALRRSLRGFLSNAASEGSRERIGFDYVRAAGGWTTLVHIESDVVTFRQLVEKARDKGLTQDPEHYLAARRFFESEFENRTLLDSFAWPWIDDLRDEFTRLYEIVCEEPKKSHHRFGASPASIPSDDTVLYPFWDWQFDQLDEQRKTLLVRLSVFVGGWTMETATAICFGGQVRSSMVQGLVTDLCAKTLVKVEERHGQRRYSLPEYVRDSARAKLASEADAEDLQRRHRDYYLELAVSAEPHLAGPIDPDWLARLAAEHQNLREALTWSLCEGGLEALILCGALQNYFGSCAHFAEGQAWCDEALGHRDAQFPTPERAKALKSAGVLAYYQRDFQSAVAYNEEALAVYGRLANRRGIADILNNSGLLARDQGELLRARTMFNEALAIRRELDDPRGIATVLYNLAGVALWEEDIGSSRSGYEQCLAIRKRLNDDEGIAYSHFGLGDVHRKMSDFPAAYHEYALALGTFAKLRDELRIANALEGLAASHTDQVLAAVLWSAATALRGRIGARPSELEQSEHDRLIKAIRLALGREAFSEAWDKGARMSWEEAVEVALANDPNR